MIISPFPFTTSVNRGLYKLCLDENPRDLEAVVLSRTRIEVVNGTTALKTTLEVPPDLLEAAIDRRILRVAEEIQEAEEDALRQQRVAKIAAAIKEELQ